MTQEPPSTELLLQGFAYCERNALVPELGTAVDHAGGWVLERRSVSSGVLELHVEVQPFALMDVYGALLASGLELTRESHRVLVQQCTCAMHLPFFSSAYSVLTLRLAIHFLPDSVQPMDDTWRLALSAPVV